MKKNNLSVALATFNEENNIEKCLESVKKIADEIIIVDGTSTDKTVEIARRMGAKVIVRENPPIFHINKQKAIDECTGKWILQLDADELVSEEMGNEIKKILDNDEIEESGFWMPRKNYFLGRFLMKGGQYPDYTVRLYRKGKGKLPQEDVHEQAVIQGKVGYLKHALLHYPYKDFNAYYVKWMRYNKLLAGQLRQEISPRNLFVRLFYGFAYLFMKPAHWMLTAYIRHKGFVDGWQGFVFALFSALRFPLAYFIYLKEGK